MFNLHGQLFEMHILLTLQSKSQLLSPSQFLTWKLYLKLMFLLAESRTRIIGIFEWNSNQNREFKSTLFSYS